MIKYMIEVIDFIGYYGPIIMFSITFYFLLNRIPYLVVFIFGSIANTILNKVLKNVFREPRPKGQLPFIDQDHLIGVEQYGLPSGHAQSVFFSLAFLFFANGPQAVLYCMVLLSFLTLYQRWKYRRHSVKQLAVGSLTGIIFSYFLIYSTQYYLYNNKNTLLYI
jgi:membrane-associated phospholipid phosphatase